MKRNEVLYVKNDFYSLLKGYVEDEAKDKDKYVKLAEKAPTEKARKILLDISREENIHRKFLQEILNDCPKSCYQEDDLSSESGNDSELDADNEIDYPDNIENSGVDEDVLKVTDNKKLKKE